jgi:glycosyltransferase involved in cell wall biosynthesis
MDPSFPRPLQPGISVVICCYNSAARLPETLRHLLAQKNAEPVGWEVIVVDNASTDATAQVAQQNWPDGGPAPLRVVREERAGLSHARTRGVAEARYDVISFIDDDNWVPPDWIVRIRALFAAHSEVGVSGVPCDPVPEIALPPWFDRLRGYYATGPQHAAGGDMTETTGTLLWGAGLNIRTQALRTLLGDGFRFHMSGRSGKNLGAGEDTELCYALREAGWRFWYDDTLVLRHFIPKERLTWPYALRLTRGMGASSVMHDLYLHALRRPPFAHYPAWKKTWLFQIFKASKELLLLGARHPVACATRPEGSWPALQFELARAKLGRLIDLAGAYQKLQTQIRRQLLGG